MLARCPTCRNTFSTDRSGRQDCPSCGKPLVVPELPSAPVASLVSPGSPRSAAAPPAPEGPSGTPWENQQPGGAFKAWRETVAQALFEPGRLFASARLSDGRKQLSFALWTGSVFTILGQLLDRFVMGPQQEQTRKLVESLMGRSGQALSPTLKRLLEASNQNSPGTTLLVALLAPVFVLAFVYVNAFVTHGFALLLGQNKKGFDATFAASAYGMATAVLLAIPLCGSPIGLVWYIVLVSVGMKLTHGTSTGGAVMTVLGPYLLVCCGFCLLVMGLASFVVPGLMSGAAGQ